MAGTQLQSGPRRFLWWLVAGSALGALLLSAALLVWARGSGVKMLGQADWPYGRSVQGTVGQTPKLLVVRSMEEFVRASGMPGDGKTRTVLERFLIKAFHTKTVDFSRQMLVVVTGGIQPTDGYRVAVTKIELNDEHTILEVYWKLLPPVPGQPVSKRPGFPAAVVLLKRFDGNFELEPATETD